MMPGIGSVPEEGVKRRGSHMQLLCNLIAMLQPCSCLQRLVQRKAIPNHAKVALQMTGPPRLATG